VIVVRRHICCFGVFVLCKGPAASVFNAFSTVIFLATVPPLLSPAGSLSPPLFTKNTLVYEKTHCQFTVHTANETSMALPVSFALQGLSLDLVYV